MSGLKFLLDTNVVIGLLDGRQVALDFVRKHNAQLGECGVSQITRMELLSFPSLTIAQEIACKQFLASVSVLIIDQQAEDAAIAVRKQAKLKLPDAIIAGTAKANGLTLLILDQKLLAATVI